MPVPWSRRNYYLSAPDGADGRRTRICTQINTGAEFKLTSYMCLLAHVEAVFSLLLCFSLSSAFTLSPTVSHLPSLHPSHSHSLLLTLSRSCLFHRGALQHLRINKLYISLCAHSKAPFRKGTKLILSLSFCLS